MKKLFLFILFNVFYFYSLTQNQTEMRVTLRDGSSFIGKVLMGKVTLVTDYGKLEIPIQNVTSIELGIISDKTLEPKIVNLIKQMGISDENLRKSAYEELTKMSIGAIGIIRDFIYSEKYVPAEYTDYTPEAALNELKSFHSVNESISDKDIIIIDGVYTIGGMYDFKKIELKTDYGTLTLPKEKINRMDMLYTPSGDANERNFILLGAKHISSNPNGGWLKTGIMVKYGQTINISATGEITLASLSNNKYKADGKVVGSATGASEYGYGEGDYSYGTASAYPVYGNVVFKINDNGAVQKAGAKFTGNANASGMLFISIYETVYNPANTGSYNVKVSVR